MSADAIASIANDPAKLPAGSAVIVDDFHTVAAAVAADMTDLVERWPAETAQLVLAAAATPRSGCTGCGWLESCARSATMTCGFPSPKAATC